MDYEARSGAIGWRTSDVHTAVPFPTSADEAGALSAGVATAMVLGNPSARSRGSSVRSARLREPYERRRDDPADVHGGAAPGSSRASALAAAAAAANRTLRERLPRNAWSGAERPFLATAVRAFAHLPNEEASSSSAEFRDLVREVLCLPAYFGPILFRRALEHAVVARLQTLEAIEAAVDAWDQTLHQLMPRPTSTPTVGPPLLWLSEASAADGEPHDELQLAAPSAPSPSKGPHGSAAAGAGEDAATVVDAGVSPANRDAEHDHQGDDTTTVGAVQTAATAGSVEGLEAGTAAGPAAPIRATSTTVAADETARALGARGPTVTTARNPNAPALHVASIESPIAESPGRSSVITVDTHPFVTAAVGSDAEESSASTAAANNSANNNGSNNGSSSNNRATTTSVSQGLQRLSTARSDMNMQLAAYEKAACQMIWDQCAPSAELSIAKGIPAVGSYSVVASGRRQDESIFSTHTVPFDDEIAAAVRRVLRKYERMRASSSGSVPSLGMARISESEESSDVDELERTPCPLPKRMYAVWGQDPERAWAAALVSPSCFWNKGARVSLGDVLRIWTPEVHSAGMRDRFMVLAVPPLLTAPRLLHRAGASAHLVRSMRAAQEHLLLQRRQEQRARELTFSHTFASALAPLASSDFPSSSTTPTPVVVVGLPSGDSSLLSSSSGAHTPGLLSTIVTTSATTTTFATTSANASSGSSSAATVLRGSTSLAPSAGVALYRLKDDLPPLTRPSHGGASARLTRRQPTMHPTTAGRVVAPTASAPTAAASSAATATAAATTTNHIRHPHVVGLSRAELSPPHWRRRWMGEDGTASSGSNAAVFMDDLRPIVETLVDRHPDLEFVRSDRVARWRYITAVIVEIFTALGAQCKPTSTVHALRRSNVAAIMVECAVVDLDAVDPCSPVRFVELNRAFNDFALRSPDGLLSYDSFPCLGPPFPLSPRSPRVRGQSFPAALTGRATLSAMALRRWLDGHGRGLSSGVPSRANFEDFCWLVAAIRDGAGRRSAAFWLQVLDMDGDGALSRQDIADWIRARDNCGVVRNNDDCECEDRSNTATTAGGRGGGGSGGSVKARSTTALASGNSELLMFFDAARVPLARGSIPFAAIIRAGVAPLFFRMLIAVQD